MWVDYIGGPVPIPLVVVAVKLPSPHYGVPSETRERRHDQAVQLAAAVQTM